MNEDFINETLCLCFQGVWFMQRGHDVWNWVKLNHFMI